MARTIADSLGALLPSRRRAGASRFGSGGILGKLYLPVFVSVLLLTAYGLAIVWSASLSRSEASLARQALGFALGWIAALVIWRYDYRNLQNLVNVLFVLAVLLMVLPRIPGLGYTAKGMTGWVRFPVIGRFQPSEPAKIVVILLMAALTAQYNGVIETLQDYVRLCAILAVPFLLILLQPDLGTGLVVLVSGAAIIVEGGAKRSWVLVTVAGIVVLAAAVIWISMNPSLPNILKPYQLKRLLVFVDPESDPTGDGYNLWQAMIAVGSGGLFGKGVGGASQSVAGFLPEAHTDFIFALLSEEFGLVGDLILLTLYGVLLISIVRLALKMESPFAKLVCVGIVAMWAFQIFENIGMNIGIMPITGIPLPFISYGSSSVITQFMAVGLVLSIYRHRQKAA